jgi:hypothetical protein
MPNMCHDCGPLSVDKGVVGPRSRHFGPALRHSSAAIRRRSYEMGPWTHRELGKVDWGKDSNWLLFGSDQLQKFSQ